MLSTDTEASKVVVLKNSYLTLHYCIQILSGPAAGTVFINTFDSRPATLQMGVGQWSEGLETVLLGHAEGAMVQADLPPLDAYGERNPALVQWVSNALFEASVAKKDVIHQPGEMVEFMADDGTRYSGIMKEHTAEAVLVDFNHPLAGAKIRLDVKILGIL